jgi:hypothetical protein
MTTNVPGPAFTANGFIPPAQSAVLAGVQEDWNVAFGTTLNFGTTGGAGTNPTPQGQITASEAAIVSNAYDLYCALLRMFDPAYAVGQWQDALGRIYFITRIPSQPTVLQCPCSGLTGAVLPSGSQIVDKSGNLYASTAAATIPSGGSVTVPFAALIPGPIPVPSTNGVSIYRAVTGWDSVTVSSGVLGNDTESRAAFETRRRAAVAKNARGILPAMLGTVLDVAGVIDAYAVENDSGSPVTVGGVSLVANSVYVAVAGGVSADIANALWSKKAPGCAWNGNTSVTVYDQNPAYNPPYPSYTVQFQRPSSLQILFAVTILSGPLVPADATTQIQTAIIAAFAGVDGGQRAKIGGTILSTRFYNPIAALGSWAQIVSIYLGCLNVPSATFTGSIAGTTLTVSAVASGTIAIGQTLVDATGNILPGTTITAGSGSTWTVSVSQTLTSETLYGVLAASPDLAVRIDQEPAISAANIVVTVS